jgi:hypothetical protein
MTMSVQPVREARTRQTAALIAVAGVIPGSSCTNMLRVRVRRRPLYGSNFIIEKNMTQDQLRLITGKKAARVCVLAVPKTEAAHSGLDE